MSLIVPETSQEKSIIPAASPEETDCDSDNTDEENDNITSLQKGVCSDSDVAVLKELVRKRLSTVSEESNSQMAVSEEKGSLV